MFLLGMDVAYNYQGDNNTYVPIFLILWKAKGQSFKTQSMSLSESLLNSLLHSSFDKDSNFLKCTEIPKPCSLAPS